jgi:hypothetical protein
VVTGEADARESFQPSGSLAHTDLRSVDCSGPLREGDRAASAAVRRGAACHEQKVQDPQEQIDAYRDLSTSLALNEVEVAGNERSM